MVDFIQIIFTWKRGTSWQPVNSVTHVLSLKKSSKTILIQKNFYVTPTAMGTSPPAPGIKLPCPTGLIVYLMTSFLILLRLQGASVECNSWCRGGNG